MGPMQKERLRPLTLAEQRELKTIAKASSERLDRVRRATAVLAVARGQCLRGGGARRPGCGAGRRSAIWCGGSIGTGLAALKIAAGRGRRPTYDAAARARIVATAQRPPDRKADGTATWSLCDPGADGAPGGSAAGGGDDDSAGAARRGQFVSADADVVPDWDGPAEAQGRGGAGGRSADRRKKGAIDQAYRLAEAAGLPVWCQDEAGPYQAIPQPGQRLGAGRRAGPPAPRVRPGRDGQAADAVPPGDRRGAGQRASPTRRTRCCTPGSRPN